MRLKKTLSESWRLASVQAERFLTLKDVELSQAHHIDYHTVELYPLPLDTIRAFELWGADLAGEKRVILSLA